MDFNEQSIGARGHCGSSHRNYLVAAAGPVRGGSDDRQVRKRLHHGDSGDVHRVSRVALEGPNAALAQNDVVVAPREHIFGAEQQLFNGGGDAALEQYGFANLAELPQQVVILHVARADLQDVGVFGQERDLRLIHDLADDEQVVAIGRRAHHFEAVFAEPLKAVRRTAGFECAPSDDAGAVACDDFSGLLDLITVLDAAGTGHDNHLAVADLDVTYLDDRPAGTEVAAGQLVGRDDAMTFLDAVHDFELDGIEIGHGTDATQQRVGDASGAVDGEAHRHEAVNYFLNLGLVGPFVHYD